MPDDTVSEAEAICDQLHGLVTDVAVANGLASIRRREGDMEAAEGLHQMARAALDQIEVRVQQLRALFQ